nr:MAG TPA: hypothetical protein [Caudoviricetes sp.]
MISTSTYLRSARSLICSYFLPVHNQMVLAGHNCFTIATI